MKLISIHRKGKRLARNNYYQSLKYKVCVDNKLVSMVNDLLLLRRHHSSSYWHWFTVTVQDYSKIHVYADWIKVLGGLDFEFWPFILWLPKIATLYKSLWRGGSNVYQCKLWHLNQNKLKQMEAKIQNTQIVKFRRTLFLIYIDFNNWCSKIFF